MEIEQYLYNLNDKGDAIIAYQMSSPSGGSIEICNMGASLLSYTLPDCDENIAHGECIWGISTLQGAQSPQSQAFAEHLWEGRVEENRVVMAREELTADGSIVIEVVFDFDDDNTLEITYIACASYDTKIDLMHALKLSAAPAIYEDERLSQGKIKYVKDAENGILKHAGKIESLGIEILTSQPAIYLDCETNTIAAHTPAEVEIKENERYVAKMVLKV